MIFQHFPHTNVWGANLTLKCFYHIWAWWPPCSTAPNHLNKLSIFFPQKAPFEICWKLLKWFQKTLKNYKILYMYKAKGQGQITPIGQNFTSLIIHCKFQLLVFNTFWENDFSTFSPYKSMGVQIWPCPKKVKGQPTTIMWINLVDLESPMLYTKTQPQIFLISGEDF